MMYKSLVLMQALMLLLLLGSLVGGADMDFLEVILEEDASFWGQRQLRGSSMSLYTGSMSMPEALSCTDKSDCDDDRPCEHVECSDASGVCVYTPKVCPFAEYCDMSDGICRRNPPQTRVTDTDCDDVQDCVDSQSITACWIEECIQGKCVYTNQECPEDNDGDPCTQNELVSRCDCIVFEKSCPEDGLVCDSSDGFCKDPADIN
jgi:hypothetical protein